MAFRFKTRLRASCQTSNASMNADSSHDPEKFELHSIRARVAERAARILAADDQEHILEALNFCCARRAIEVDTAKSPVLVREALDSNSYDALLIDLNYTRDTTSGQEGLDLLSEIVAMDSTLPVIVMTAWGNVGLAVEAMRRGARDFIQKPWENERLADHSAHPGGTASRPAAGSSACRRRTDCCGPTGVPHFIATAPVDAAGARHDRAHRAIRRERADHRRAWHRQRSGGSDAARTLARGFASRWLR